MKEKILEGLKNFLWKALPWIICIILAVALARSCSDAREQRDINEHNVIALTDSVHYYKDKFGQEVAAKTILIGDMETLRLANDSLADKIQAMLGKEKPQQVIYINNDIIHEKHDTCWVWPELVNNFDFSDKWRELSGNVSLQDSILGLHIQKDIVHAGLAIAIKDGKAYVSSDNPYLHVSDIQGVTIPTPKQKRWHIGPSIGVGIGEDLKIHPNVSVGVTYSIFSW